MTTAVLPRRLSFPASDQSPILWVPAQEGRHSCLPCLAYSVGRQTGMSAPPLILPKNMTDPNSPSHWDALASDLGATPPTEDAEPQPSSPPPSQPVTPPKSAPRAPRDKRPSSGPVRAGDWDSIASELGVTPAPQPVAPVVEAKAAAAAAPTRAKPEQRNLPAPERVPERAEDSPNFFDESFDFEEPFDLLESSETPAAAAPPKDKESEESEDRGEPRDRKRRRRRRSGRDSDRRDSRGPAAAGAAKGRPVQAAQPEKEPDRAATSAAAEEIKIEVEEVRVETTEDEERRPRRRRSRRGGKKRRPGDESAPATAGAPAKEEAIAEHAPRATRLTLTMMSAKKTRPWTKMNGSAAIGRRGSASAGFPPGRRPSGW